MTTAPVGDARFHAVQRRLAALLPDAAMIAGGGTLELSRGFLQEKPRLEPPELLEGDRLRAHDVDGAPVVRFAAFLDGTQASRVVQYAGAIPVVHGTVAAVVRARHDRRLTTWRAPRIERRLYAPLALLPPTTSAALAGCGVDLSDTTARRELESIHPFALQEAALQAVQRDRAALERELAESWCVHGDGVLFVDGGISESQTVASSDRVVGVVKSHQQLHAGGDDLPVLVGLAAGQRSSVVRVTSRRRTPVASWYLRLRSGAAGVGGSGGAGGGRDPLWGLIRVEVAEPAGASRAAIGRRADEVSRWVLAEALPLATPDGRWDKMVYGIQDCEEFLRAIQ